MWVLKLLRILYFLFSGYLDRNVSQIAMRQRNFPDQFLLSARPQKNHLHRLLLTLRFISTSIFVNQREQIFGISRPKIQMKSETKLETSLPETSHADLRQKKARIMQNRHFYEDDLAASIIITPWSMRQINLFRTTCFLPQNHSRRFLTRSYE